MHDYALMLADFSCLTTNIRFKTYFQITLTPLPSKKKGKIVFYWAAEVSSDIVSS